MLTLADAVILPVIWQAWWIDRALEDAERRSKKALNFFLRIEEINHRVVQSLLQVQSTRAPFLTRQETAHLQAIKDSLLERRFQEV